MSEAQERVVKSISVIQSRLAVNLLTKGMLPRGHPQPKREHLLHEQRDHRSEDGRKRVYGEHPNTMELEPKDTTRTLMKSVTFYDEKKR